MDGTSLNILSNNCLGGFIYRDILHVPYSNPFIWTLFDTDMFISFLSNYSSINFGNYTVKKRSENWDIDDDFDTIIDNRYIIQNIHMHFDAHATVPTTVNDAKGIQRSLWTNGVRYAFIWEYIADCYKKRVARMARTSHTAITFWSIDSTFSQVSHIVDICKRLNYPALIFDNRLNHNQYASSPVKILPVTDNIERPQQLIAAYGDTIRNFCEGIIQ